MTTWPYKVAYGFLIVSILQCQYLMYMLNVVFDNDFEDFREDWISHSRIKIIFIFFELTKLGFIIALLTVQWMRAQILYVFITFQQKLRLEYLPIERDRYQRQEKAQIRFFKTAVASIFPIIAILTLLVCLEEYYHFMKIDVWTSIAYQLIFGAGWIVITSNAFIHHNLWLLIAMYFYRRYEYYKHYKKQLALTFVTYLSMYLLLFAYFACIWTSYCVGKEEDSSVGAYYHSHGYKEDGWCAFWAYGFHKTLYAKQSKSFVTAMYCGYNMLEILPFIAFYCFSEPHDCFECLGKDPARIYSTLQLNKCERAERKMYAKYGMRSSQAIASYERKI